MRVFTSPVLTGAPESSAISRSVGPGYPTVVPTSCAPHPLSRDRGERRWFLQGLQPRPLQAAAALCPVHATPWTNEPDVCSASTFWAGVLLRDGIPWEAVVPAA